MVPSPTKRGKAALGAIGGRAVAVYGSSDKNVRLGEAATCKALGAPLAVQA